MPFRLHQVLTNGANVGGHGISSEERLDAQADSPRALRLHAGAEYPVADMDWKIERVAVPVPHMDRGQGA